MPQLSVIIPVFNGEAFLKESLASIPSHLDAQIILVDDGSSDGSLEVGRAHGAQIVEAGPAPQGPAAARNRGLRMVEAPYVAFLDADDWWPQGSVEERLRFLKENPEVAVVQGLIETREQGVLGEAVAGRRLSAPAYNVNLGACLFRREVLDKVGPFDETLRFGEDFDLFMRLWEEDVDKRFLQSTCLYYRLHQTNMTNEGPEDTRTKLKVLKRHKDRMKGRLAQKRVPLEHYVGWIPPLDIRDGEFTKDYVSLRVPRWKEWFAHFRGLADLNILELGSYEGLSARWFSQNLCTHPTARLTCVDFFVQPEVEGRFDRNLQAALAEGRVVKVKEKTHRWLSEQKAPVYDLIYVDASHRAADVLLDAMLCWQLLRPGGRMLLDDYLWQFGKDPLERPQLAIDLLLAARLEGMELLHRGYQVLVARAAE